MAQFVVDFSDVKDFSPMPAGKYWLEIKEVTPTKSKKGSPMLKVKLEVVEHPEYTGRVIYVSWVIKGDGAGFTRDAFTAFDIPEGAVDTDDMIGLQAEAIITSSVWTVEDGGDGKTRNKVSSWVDPNPVDADGWDDLVDEDFE